MYVETLEHLAEFVNLPLAAEEIMAVLTAILYPNNAGCGETAKVIEL